jgi:hypothetical protein
MMEVDENMYVDEKHNELLRNIYGMLNWHTYSIQTLNKIESILEKEKKKYR